MMEEANLLGVYVSGALVASCMAWVALAILRPALRWVGFYRLVWHPALVNIALFGILWGLCAWALPLIARMIA
jgi:hypothetical protein